MLKKSLFLLAAGCLLSAANAQTDTQAAGYQAAVKQPPVVTWCPRPGGCP